MAHTAKKLEDILVDAGIATTKDLERARRRMSERGGRLLANLAALEGFDDVHFARGLGKALGLPVVEGDRLTRVAAPRTPSRRAALRALAIERVLLPTGAVRSPRAVEVAMFDPTDAEAIDRLRVICGGMNVRIMVAPRRALLDAIALTYGREAAGAIESPPAPAAVIEDTPQDPLPGFDDIDITVDGGDTPTPNPRSDSERTLVVPRPSAQARNADLATTSYRRVESANPTPTPPPSAFGPRDVRLLRVVFDVVATLADRLEERVAHQPPIGRRLARLARLVARDLGLSPSIVEEIGLAAQLFAVDRVLREEARREGRPPSVLVGDMGWAAGSPDGVAPILNALAAVADGFPAPWRAGATEGGEVDAPLGAQIISAVSEYLSLAEATPDAQPDPGTVNQLLRVTTAPEIIDALTRVLDAKRNKESSHAG